MIEIVPPLYLALAMLMLALTLAARPSRDERLLPTERSSLHGMVGGICAALACVFIALVPLLGRALLMVSSIMLWLSFLATTLRVRSWRHSLTPGLTLWSSLAMALVCMGMMVLRALGPSLPLRVISQLCVTLALLGWMLYELQQVARLGHSLQLNMMRSSVVGLMLLASFWSWLLLTGHLGGMLHFSTLFSEASLSFAMRLFVVAMVVLMLISANGYGLERMVALKASASNQKEIAEQLNLQLGQALVEKNEMLQALSFAVRSQNLPVIMSSLSHEINQPLGAIRLNADYLLAENTRLSALERDQVLQQLVSCSEAVATVVKDFRRFLDAAPTPRETVDLPLLLADLERALHTDFMRQHVKVTLCMDEPLKVLGDPVQLESALAGVMQFMLRRFIDQPRTMRVDHVRAGRFVHIQIVDDGLPLTQAEFEQALVRSDNTPGRYFSQSLWLSRAIVEHHGGAMNRHEADHWTGVCLQLPILEEQ